MPASSSVLRNSPLANSSKRIWIVNPFDELPNATDVPLRYWALCRTLAEQGHEVIWWSSDFSHRTKTQRKPCPPTDGFSIRLIASSPYAKNISLARLKNHKQFAQGFFRDAIDGLKSGALNAPDQIVVSLPPLGVAESAFAIRDFVASGCSLSNQETKNTPHSPIPNPQASVSSPCEVTLDIMDAWPEAFYQVLPKSLRAILGPILLAPMHRSAQRAYEGADKISAVGQNYLERAKSYLQQGAESKEQRTTSSDETASRKVLKPMFLCYHGTDLERVAQNHGGMPPFTQDSRGHTIPSTNNDPLKAGLQAKHSRPCAALANQGTMQHSAKHLPTQPEHSSPIRLVYIGALETSYDLNTILEATKLLNQKGNHTEFHIAGAGSRKASLKELIQQTNQALGSPVIFFHGYLRKTELDVLLHQAHFGIIPMTDASFVGLPYKMADYTRMGLPILSSLDGECRELIEHKKAGAFYRSGSSARLADAIQSIIQQPALYHSMSIHSRQIAEQLFDRSITYQALAAFIVGQK